MKEKILCIQLKQIGDVLINTPAIRALAQQFPNSEIHVITEPPAHQIFEFSPYVHKVHKYPKKDNILEIIKLIRRLRKERYDCVVDFQGIPKTALLAWLTGASKRIGGDSKGRSMFYTHAVAPSTHTPYSAQRKAFLLSPLEVEVNDFQLDFFTSNEDDQKSDSILKQLNVNKNQLLISISPVSRREYKVWPATYFSAICDFLIETYKAQILFLWGPGEYHFIEAVRNNMKYKDLGDYDIPTLRETVALLKNVNLHVGNDNGPMHFANAAQKPSIAIFGRPLMQNWIEPGNQKHLGIEYDPNCKNACYYPKCQLACIKGVEISAVKELIQKLLKNIS